ncbi:MAG: ABC transporter permease subunit [Desulfitobacteriia bacterium]
MGPIFAEALSRILKPKKVIIYLLIVSLVSVSAAMLSKYFFGSSILKGQIITFTSCFLGLSYLWILGLPLVLWIIYQGLGLIAEEREAGTLLLLFSKPLSRPKIFWGKFLALILAAILLAECSLFLALSLMTFFVFPDVIIALNILRLFPYLNLYMLFITVCFASLSAGLSIWCKSRKKAMGGFLLFILIIYLVLPLLKLIPEYNPAIIPKFSLGNWLKYLSYFDPSAHLSSVFAYFLNFAGELSLSPAMTWGTRVSPVVILIIWLAVCLLLLGWALRNFNNLELPF